MKKLHTLLALAFLSTSLMGGVALAQDHHDNGQDRDHHDNGQDRDHHDNHGYVEHREWRKGARLRHEDWDRGDRVDYRQYHLSPPPRGYEWRMVDGYYVLANVSSFQIHTVIRIR
ncbi:MAG: RcnB family protein [Terracidiphilus sp.]|jgi:Ni/Co efflux regulator RcnB